MTVTFLTANVPQAPPVQPVKIALFEDLQDVPHLIQKLRSGTLAVGMVDARTIVSTRHLLAAIFRALNDQSNGRMKTRNVHSEVLLALNNTNNIAEAYRKFGVQPDTHSLLAVKIGEEHEASVAAEFEEAIQGSSVAVEDEVIARVSDLDAICKLYKLGTKAGDAKLSDKGEIEARVIEAIALRGAT